MLLAREVDHRAKNTLAVVLSVLRLTRAPTTPEFITAVEGRVHALAATHNLLSSTRWEGADLRKIVEEEMAPYHATHRQRVITAGPAVVLLPATAQAVALALHELATNAAKYGALSTETGTLTVSWKTGDDSLMLDWVETGGPPDGRAGAAGLRPHHRALQHRGAVPRRRQLRLAARGPVLPAVHPGRPDRRRADARGSAGRGAVRQSGAPQPRRHAPDGGRGRASGQHAAEGHPDRPRRGGRGGRTGGCPTAWPPPRSSASTAPSSISTSPDSRPSRWPTCCWRAACRSCSSPAISATASTGATPTCRCCPSRSIPPPSRRAAHPAGRRAADAGRRRRLSLLH